MKASDFYIVCAIGQGTIANMAMNSYCTSVENGDEEFDQNLLYDFVRYIKNSPIALENKDFAFAFEELINLAHIVLERIDKWDIDNDEPLGIKAYDLITDVYKKHEGLYEKVYRLYQSLSVYECDFESWRDEETPKKWRFDTTSDVSRMNVKKG